jgi:AmmeMemoRadiSam system protein B
MTVVFGGLTPHAPVLIPDIGRHDLLKLNQTVSAMKELARQVLLQEPDVVVIVTPHGKSGGEAFGVYGREWLLGDFAHYRAPQVTLDAPGDPVVASAIRDLAEAADLAIVQTDRDQPVPLDYGVSVPLYYLQKAGYQGAVVPVTVSHGSREDHRAFGRAIAQAVSALGKSTVLLASGDLSHRLTANAPAGFAPEGARFDELLVKLLGSGNWDEIFKMDDQLWQNAGECGYRALLVLLGALERSMPRAQMLAYEGPFGVGYATATIEVDAPERQDDAYNPAGFARQVVDTFLQTDRLPPVPPDFPKKPVGCFVCLKRDGEVAVCVGSVAPVEDTLAQEIARHALMAIRHYAEHHAANIDDVIHHLEFSVDLLEKPQRIKDLTDHDPSVYGLVVEGRGRQGVVLPDRAPVTTAEEQLALALDKAGLKADEAYTMSRFRVERHAEMFRPAW